jgi:tetratricopeptide (TPR) repeat protein
MTFKPAFARLLAMVLCMGLATPVMSQSDDLQEAQQLLKQGQIDRAMERVDQYLKSRPNDARGRFLRGILFTEQNKPNDAIRIFTELTRDYPELPEPYNNLAVLQASQGQYDKARAALEMAIRTHPSYATAHENLGDIYAKMASQAYDKALRLDKSNQAAQTKLNLIKDLFTSGPRLPVVAMAKVEPAPKPTPPPVAKAITPAPAAVPKPTPAPVKEAAKVAAITPEKEAAKPQPKEPVREPVKVASTNNPEAVLKAVENWAEAWSNNDVARYLGHYAPDFQTPNGASRKDWEKERRSRVAKPRSIEVSVNAPKVTFSDASHATVTFRQQYRSNTFKANAQKTLVMIKSGERWLIQQETVGG